MSRVAHTAGHGTHISNTDLQGTCHCTFELSGDVVCGPRQRNGSRRVYAPCAQERCKILHSCRRRSDQDDVPDDSEGRSADDEWRPAIDVV